MMLQKVHDASWAKRGDLSQSLLGLRQLSLRRLVYFDGFQGQLAVTTYEPSSLLLSAVAEQQAPTLPLGLGQKVAFRCHCIQRVAVPRRDPVGAQVVVSGEYIAEAGQSLAFGVHQHHLVTCGMASGAMHSHTGGDVSLAVHEFQYAMFLQGRKSSVRYAGLVRSLV